MTAWTELDVEVDGGTRLHCRRAGSGPPVLLLHGVLDDGACSPRVAAALVGDHEVVAYDARFHGESVETPDAEWGGPDDTLAVVDALGLERPVLVGHSMGGAVGAQAVATAPERFRGAVLEDPGWITLTEGPALDAGRAAFAQMLTMPEAELVAQARVASPAWDEAELAPWARAKRGFHGADQLAGGVAVLGTRPWREVVPDLAVPVLLACGGNVSGGRIVTEDMAEEARALAPDLAVVTFPEAGHNVRREAFDGFLAAVTRFLQDHP